VKKFIVGVFVFALFATIIGSIHAASPARVTGQAVVAGSTSVQPLAEELADAFMSKNPGARVQVQGGGSSAGIAAALSGAAQIGMSSRELKPTETGLTAVEIAKDGIAFVVHPSNTQVANLTNEQIRKIFAGEITNWKEVGGKNEKILVVTREAGSGTRGAFEELVMGKSKITTDAIVQGSTGAVMTTVAQAKNGIGYISMGSLDKTVKAIKVDGVAATEENVVKKQYKVSRPFLFLTKGQPTGVAKAFIDFILSKDGQKIVGRDYIPVSR
jgi:phosphate transport system substrate-binding protein